MNEQPVNLIESIEHRKAFYKKIKELYKLLFNTLKNLPSKQPNSNVIGNAENKTSSFYELIERINDIDTYYGEVLDIEPETYYHNLVDTGTPNNIKYYHAEINHNGYNWLKSNFDHGSWYNHIVWAKILSYKYYLKTYLLEHGLDPSELEKYNSRGQQVEPTLKELIELLNVLPLWEKTKIEISMEQKNGQYIAYSEKEAIIIPSIYTLDNEQIKNKNIELYIDGEKIEFSNPDVINFTLVLPDDVEYKECQCKIKFLGYDNYKESELDFIIILQPQPYILTASVINQNIESPLYTTIEDDYPEVIITEESVTTSTFIKGYIEGFNDTDVFTIKANINGEIIAETIRLYNYNNFHFRHDGVLSHNGQNYDYEFYWNGIKIYPHLLYDVKFISDIYIDNDELILDKEKLRYLRDYPCVTSAQIQGNHNLIINKINYQRTDDIHSLLSTIYWSGDNLITKTISDDIQLVTTPNSTIGLESDIWQINLKLTNIDEDPQVNIPIRMLINENYIMTFYTDVNGEVHQDYLFDFETYGNNLEILFETEYGNWRDTFAICNITLYHKIFDYDSSGRELILTFYDINTGEININKGQSVEIYDEDLDEIVEYHYPDSVVIINGEEFYPENGIIKYLISDQDLVTLIIKEEINGEYETFTYNIPTILTMALLSDVIINENGNLVLNEVTTLNDELINDININEDGALIIDTIVLNENDNYNYIISKIEIDENGNLIIKNINDLL